MSTPAILNAATLVAEYAPKVRRAAMMTFMYCGFTVGAAVGGYLTTFVIHAGSWRWALIVGAILPKAAAGCSSAAARSRWSGPGTSW